MLGTYLVKKLKKKGFTNLNLPKKKELNLLNEKKIHIYINVFWIQAGNKINTPNNSQ